MIGAFVLITADAERIAELGAELADIPGVTEAHSVTGDVDLIAVLRVRTHEEIADIVTRRIAKLGGVRTTRTMIAFRSYSGADLDAAYAGMDD